MIKGLFSKITLLAMWHDMKRNISFVNNSETELLTELLEWRGNIEECLFKEFNLEIGKDGFFHKAEEKK
jgi:hypothetical protein